MDIVKLAGSVTHTEFKDCLYELEKLNRAGKLREFSENFNLIVQEGTSVFDSFGYAYFDAMINSETGQYKDEVEKVFARSGENTIY